jgi:hypothetical protein
MMLSTGAPDGAASSVCVAELPLFSMTGTSPTTLRPPSEGIYFSFSGTLYFPWTAQCMLRVGVRFHIVYYLAVM